MTKNTITLQKALFIGIPLIVLLLTGCPKPNECSDPTSNGGQCSSTPESPLTPNNTPLITPWLASPLPGDTSVDLSWNSIGFATSYDIYRSGMKVASTSMTSFTDTNLINGETYSYCVMALNSTDRSEKSKCVSVKPMPQQVFAAGTIIPSGWDYIIDSSNNIYSANAGGGLLKTSPTGATTVFLSGKSLYLINKDLMDNIYVLVDNVGTFRANGNTLSSTTIQKISSTGVISTFCGASQCGSMPVVQGIANGGGVVTTHSNGKTKNPFRF